MLITLTTTDLVAWWGAIVATLVLLWDIVKYMRSGPQIRINVQPNMETFGMPGTEGKTYVTVEAVNIGDRPTTLRMIALMYYCSFFRKFLRRKPDKMFISLNPVLTQPLPFVLEPGKMWAGGLIQNDKMEQMVREGILICEVYDSWHTKGFRKRIKIKKKSSN